MSITINPRPFLKWAGGKTQLLNLILPLIPDEISSYHEPFVGGGAVLFALAAERPKLKLSLADTNEELINCYQVIRRDLHALCLALNSMREEHSESFFMSTRSWDRDPDWPKTQPDYWRAARFIYLNKTGFNGLCRYNKQGQFNTSWGKYTEFNAPDEEHLKAVKQVLDWAEIEVCDFQALYRRSLPDFVYLDPPYVPVSETSNFTGYNQEGFGHQDQIKLSAVCQFLNTRGVKFLLSNSDTDIVKDLYQNFDITEVDAARSINSNTSKRGKVKELLIKNY